MQDVYTLVLGGGLGERLYPLTRNRSEPAVPLAGKYRLIDVPLSNCLNSGLNKIFVLTQFLSVSLHRHISQTYKLDPFNGGFIDVLPAQQTNETMRWYKGTADALRQNRMYIENYQPRDVLVLYADQIYRMDFSRLVKYHRARDADITAAVLPVTGEKTSRVGVLRIDDDDRVQEFVEKPTGQELGPLSTSEEVFRRHEVESAGREYLANMGIYLFKRETLLELFDTYPDAKDIVNELLLPSFETHKVHARLFDSYWEDLGTIRSYFDAHMGLLQDNPEFDFHEMERAIFTRMRNLPATRLSDCRIDQSLIADGCIVRTGSHLRRCVLGIRSQVDSNVQMHNVVMLGADKYEPEASRAENARRGRPNLGVGEGSIIENAILDKDCRIGRDVKITNAEGLQEAETDLYVIRDGIVVIPNEVVVPDGTVI